MPRGQRQQSSCDLYHIMARGVARCIIYEDDNDRRFFLSLLKRYFVGTDISLLAWCLMDNHYHLLAHGDIHALSKGLQAINSTYAMYFNERHGRVGHLFQNRFKSKPIEGDEHLLTELRYIHRNPVKDGISPTCHYQWSSFDGYFESPWLVDNELVVSLFESEEEFLRFHEQDDYTSCLSDEVRPARKPFSDEDARAVAEYVLGEIGINDVAGLARSARNEALRSLRSVGLTLRQIERLTGVPKSVIARV